VDAGAAVTSDVAFAAFYREQRANAMRLAHLLTGSVALAEDVVQDVFMGLLPRFGSIEDPVAYLRRSVVNGCRSVRRRQVRAGAWRHLLVVEEAVSPVTSDMLDAVDRLPYRYRAVLILRYWAGLDERSIAEALGCRPGTVKTWSARGLRQLRRDLA
jgi:RNA polymerase sigma factor (sigma-70 family)